MINLKSIKQILVSIAIFSFSIASGIIAMLFAHEILPLTFISFITGTIVLILGIITPVTNEPTTSPLKSYDELVREAQN